MEPLRKQPKILTRYLNGRNMMKLSANERIETHSSLEQMKTKASTLGQQFEVFKRNQARGPGGAMLGGGGGRPNKANNMQQMAYMTNSEHSTEVVADEV